MGALITAVAAFGLLFLREGSAKPPQPLRFDTIELRGAMHFAQQVSNALALIKSRSPSGYCVVTGYVARIDQSAHTGMAADKRIPTFQLNDRTAYYSLTWCAGAIAHDSYHSKLYHDWITQHHSRSVPAAVWTGEAAEKQCLAHQKRVMEELGAPANEMRWQARTNHYWEVDYNKRNW
jgi:hypothetical protein